MRGNEWGWLRAVFSVGFGLGIGLLVADEDVSARWNMIRGFIVGGGFVGTAVQILAIGYFRELLAEKDRSIEKEREERREYFVEALKRQRIELTGE